MIVLPAIDILGGKPVRLIQGDYSQASQVAASVTETAKAFEKAGASFLHLVDLDGARQGFPVNRDLIVQTARSLSIPVEAGGGIRTLDQARDYLDHGVERVILSTAALKDPAVVARLVEAYPGRIAAGLDCRNGQVRVAGWLEDGGMSIEEAVQAMEKAGIQTMIITDISKDGMLSGPSFDLYKRLRPLLQDSTQLIASGGISSLEDLCALQKDGAVQGAITGKAIYSGALDLGKAVETLQSLIGDGLEGEKISC